jgi:sugar phosphate isomerase/epimerase
MCSARSCRNCELAELMNFGISTHLFHGDRLAAGHFDRIRDAGFRLVEVFATRTHFDYRDRRAASVVRDWMDARGLAAWSVHAPICDGFRDGVWGRAYSNASKDASLRAEAVAETIASIDAASMLGAKIVVLHLGIPIGQPIAPNDNDPGSVSRALEAMATAAEAAGVRLAIEVIPNALATAEAVAGWLEGELNLGRAGACLDFGHAHITGGAPEAIERLSGHIITTHVHDNTGRSDDHLLPFSGTLDWPSSLTALWKIGYQGPLMFELPDHGDADRVLVDAVRAQAKFQRILKDVAEPFPFRDDA